MKNPWARAVLMSAVLVLGASAASAETSFPATVQLGGQTLVKNGQGTRYRAVFKVYDMALYLPSRTQDAAQVLAMPGAKRASFVALRDIPGDQFGLSLVSGMRENINPQHAAEVVRHMNDVIAVFSTETTIRAGQSFRVDHVPGKGTSFFLDDKQKGPTVANPLFAEAVFSIWMGRKPVETQLKDGLLGRAAPAVNAQLSN